MAEFRPAEFRDECVLDPGNFGYAVDGTLRCRAPPHAQFQWDPSNPRQQQEYDALADSVLAYCQRSLGQMLEEVELPGSGTPVWVSRPGAASGTTEHSPAARTLLLIQGSGRVRAGVWGCALCINAEEGLRKGTMMEYIERAHALGYRVVVANPNAEADTAGHIRRLWQHVVMRPCGGPSVGAGAGAGDGATEAAGVADGSVDVVAHSRGGRTFLELLQSLADDRRSVLAIGRVAATDSYHDSGQVDALRRVDNAPSSGCDSATLMRLLHSVRNYVPSTADVGAPVDRWTSLRMQFTANEKAPMQCISACTDDHASTNYCAVDAIFAWLAEDEEDGDDMSGGTHKS